MISEIDSYLANIEEYVFDERKIVTCSWLSKTLEIHTNLSKQLLHTFFEQSPKKDELSVTYLLIGSPEDDGRSQISIVKDKDLEKCEGSWKEITSKHIYSIQKCSDLADLNVLYVAQKGENINTLSKGLSAIDFNCNERDNTLIAKLRSNALPVPVKQPFGVTKNSVSQPLPPKNKFQSPAKAKENKTSEEDKASTSGSKGSVIPSMFKNSKPTVNKTSLSNKPATNTKKPQGIGSFFSKTTNKQSNEIKKQEDIGKAKEKEDSNPTERNSPSKENKQTLNIVKEDNICKKNNAEEDKTKIKESPKEILPKSKKSQSKHKVTTKKGNSKKGSTKKVEKEQKKRKRLVVASDSESENSSEGEEEMREPSPEPQPTVVPDDDDVISATPEPATRKRKKKLINKTFKTPDGYMMTKKEWVDVSGSEEEEESAPEKKFKENPQEDKGDTTSGAAPTKSSPLAKKDVPVNKKGSPQKTKQASLTSFFKKK